MINSGVVTIDLIAHRQHLPQCNQPRNPFVEKSPTCGCVYNRNIPPKYIDVATATLLHFFGTSVGVADLNNLLDKLGYEPLKKKELTEAAR